MNKIFNLGHEVAMLENHIVIDRMEVCKKCPYYKEYFVGIGKKPEFIERCYYTLNGIDKVIDEKCYMMQLGITVLRAIMGGNRG